MRALGYIRVSTDQQFNGIEVQKEYIERYVARNNINLYKIFIDEGVSGRAEKKEALSSLMDEVERGDLVIVHKRDRISRDLGMMIFFEKEMKKRGAKIISTTGEGTSGVDDESSMLLRRMIDVFSEHERLVISNRIKRAMQAKKSRNELVGRVPYGKSLCEDGIHLKENPEEQIIIKNMLELFWKMSMIKTANKLNELGMLNRGGKLWNRASVEKITRNNTLPTEPMSPRLINYKMRNRYKKTRIVGEKASHIQ